MNDGYTYTAPVGTYPSGASPYGALDMAGNVWEWVVDWYGGSYYASSSSTNPRGPDSGDARIMRGGSWVFNSDGARVSYRYPVAPDYISEVLGFRCVFSP